jgi:hypothetical protein
MKETAHVFRNGCLAMLNGSMQMAFMLINMSAIMYVAMCGANEDI